MDFITFKQENSQDCGFYEADIICKQEFIKISFENFKKYSKDNNWVLKINSKGLNSYPNFTQKHSICISNTEFKNAYFQFRICCENNTNSLGYRLFSMVNSNILDFVTNDISKSDEIAMSLKNGLLKNFKMISKCGWWITDIWREMFIINEDSKSENFIKNIIENNYTHIMLQINEILQNAQNSGDLDELIAKSRQFYELKL